MAKQLTIFEYLDYVRDRPRMYCNSIQDLAALIQGYYVALQLHGIVETVPEMGRHFNLWVCSKKGWSPVAGWTSGITNIAPSFEEHFDLFFELVDEYRQLRPVVVRRLVIDAQKYPASKGVVIGLGQNRESPMIVEAIQYQPEPLHFFRYHFASRIVDDWAFEVPVGDIQASIDQAVESLSAKLGVPS